MFHFQPAEQSESFSRESFQSLACETNDVMSSQKVSDPNKTKLENTFLKQIEVFSAPRIAICVALMTAVIIKVMVLIMHEI